MANGYQPPAEESFLGRMAAASRARVRAARTQESEADLEKRALARPTPPQLSLGDFDIIAELKKRSPAAGVLTEERFDRDTQIKAYAEAGAAAISVLTEPDEFKGSLADLEAAGVLLGAHDIPAMRKDFLTDPYQILEARAHGAGGVLVIVTMLSDSEIDELVDCASRCQLFVLLEGFDRLDLERMNELGARLRSATVPVLCGVNCRDLKTLEIDFERFEQLSDALPDGFPAVAESGIGSPEDIAAVARAGYSLALIGSALMQSPDPAQRLGEFLRVGKEKATCS